MNTRKQPNPPFAFTLVERVKNFRFSIPDFRFPDDQASTSATQWRGSAQSTIENPKSKISRAWRGFTLVELLPRPELAQVTGRQSRPATIVSRAFTLIELLAVITIIGILAAIIIPVVGRVRQSAADATCKSNVRQLTMAYVMFLNDHKMLSLPNTVNNTNEWSAYSNEGVGQGTFHGFYLLRWYYKPGPNRIRLSGTKYLYEKIEHCPSVRMNGLTQDPTMMAAQKSDYGVRQPPSETVEGVARVKLVNFGLCTQPSRTPLVFDHFQGAWKTSGSVLETHLPLRHRGKRSINCGFLDGHVAYVDGDEKDGRLYMQYWRDATMNQEPNDNDLRKGSALGLTEMPAAPSESGG